MSILKKITNEKELKKKVRILFKDVLIIELMATVVSLSVNLFEGFKDRDWATGIMRHSTMYVFMLIMAFSGARICTMD